MQSPYAKQEMELDFDNLPVEPISRYITKDRLCSLLEDGLYIPNLTQFEDRFEGLLGVVLRRRIALKQGTRYVFSQEDYESAFRWVHASCWYIGVDENFLMWRSYGQSKGDSVLIETTRSRLEEVYRRSDECYTAYIDKVRYYEVGEEPVHIQLPSLIAPWGMRRPTFGPEIPDLLDLLPDLFSKYGHFRDERELRLACVNRRHGDEGANAGLTLKIDDPVLFFRRIRICPFASDEHYSQIQEIVSQHIPDLVVERSSISVRA